MTVYHFNTRYYDLITPSAPVDERSAEEIIKDIVTKIEEL